MQKLIMIGSIIAMLLVMIAAARAEGAAGVGNKAPHFTLEDQTGKTVKLGDYAGKIIVLEWTNPACPFVKRHYEAGTMTGLANKYKEHGVVWLAINSNASASDEANAKFAEAHHLPYPVLNDSQGTVGKAYGAKATPTMVIISKEGAVVYRGAIDNDPQGNRLEGKVNYVQKALDEVLAGKTVSTPEIKPYGCGIKYR